MDHRPYLNDNPLLERLAHALSGTAGRKTSVDSIRSITALEVLEWRQEMSQRAVLDCEIEPLIAGTTNQIG